MHRIDAVTARVSWAGILLALGLVAPACAPRHDGGVQATATAGKEKWQVLPFRLDQVSLRDGLFKQKRDRMLAYARGYGGETDIYAGPDRLLSIFRANAGLDTRGARAVGGWESETGYLRGHYAGHFMSLLAQAWASTGEEIYKRKLDYMVEGLAECQATLAESASRPTPRVPGRSGGAVRLSGSPLGLAEHLRLPEGELGLSDDFTLATWINLSLYDAMDLPDARQTPLELTDGTVIFDFGSPNPEYSEAPLAHMYLAVRSSDERPGPRFAITANGEEGEQSLESDGPLPIGEWVHVAVTKSGPNGTLFVDGEAVATTDTMSLTPTDLGLEDNWIGRRQFPQRTVSYLNATLDDFLVLDRGLAAEEVALLLESPESVIGDSATAWYRFDETEGPSARDSSGNGRDAEIIAPTDGRRHPGFLSAYPETQFIRLEEFATYGASQGIWAPYYTLHKIMAGLIDAHLLADNELALDVLTGIGDWVHSRVAPLDQEQLDRMWDIYIAGEYGGINESLATLQALTPEREAYLEAARRFVNRNIYTPVAAGEDVLDGRHANQHIPQFTGYLRTYELGHDATDLAAAKNFWDMVVPARIYSHGGVGVGEMLRGNATAASLFEERDHAETCPLYNLLKLSRNLFFHDPDPKYMNYYELGLFNQMLGSRRDIDSLESPEVTYFVPVQPGRRRRYGNVGTCCGGTGLESHTKYQDSIYFHSVDGSTLYVNLYIASVLEWPERGFTIVQETRYPEEGASRLIVDGTGELEIKFRVPSWVRKGYRVEINGEAQELEAAPGTYVSLSRDWSDGDIIDIVMPLSFRVESAPDDPSVQSIYYGPTLLAAQADAVGEDLESGLLEVSLYRYLQLDGDLASTEVETGRPLHFRLGELLMAPFFVADPVEDGPTPTPAVESAETGEEREKPPTRAYHLYLRRHEPRIVFGSVDSGVANPAGEDGLTFLDNLWAEAPFESHDAFVSSVERDVALWTSRGALSSRQGEAIVDAARRAEADLRPPETVP